MQGLSEKFSNLSIVRRYHTGLETPLHAQVRQRSSLNQDSPLTWLMPKCLRSAIRQRLELRT